MKKVKVLHITYDWLPITMDWLYNIVTKMQNEYDLHIVCSKQLNESKFEVNNLTAFEGQNSFSRFYDKSVKRVFGGRNYGFFQREIEKIKPDLIHSHFGDVAWRNNEYANENNIPHITTFYGYDVNMLTSMYPQWKERYKELFSSISKVFCEGPYMKSSIMALGCPEEKIIVHHIGVDLKNLQFKPRELLKKEPIKILLASSFREKKGIPDALKAIAIFKKVTRRDVKVTIIGDASDEKVSLMEKNKILKTVEEYNLTGITEFKGFVNHDKMMEIAYDHHVFLHPSKYALNGDCEGGAPVVIIEMLASGMPVISTRHCDIPNIIRENVTGYLADEGDIEGLAELLAMTEKDFKRWEPLLKNGRELIESEFDVDKQASKLIRHYKEIFSS